MKKPNKYTQPAILSLNDDRGDAFWQTERGPRYGVARKAIAKAKVHKRRSERKDKSYKKLTVDSH